MVELSGESTLLDAFLSAINKKDILEISRTGVMGVYCDYATLKGK